MNQARNNTNTGLRKMPAVTISHCFQIGTVPIELALRAAAPLGQFALGRVDEAFTVCRRLPCPNRTRPLAPSHRRDYKSQFGSHLLWPEPRQAFRTSRPQSWIERPADCPDCAKGEPKAERYRYRDHPQSPRWQTVHCSCPPSLAEPTLTLEWLRSYLCVPTRSHWAAR